MPELHRDEKEVNKLLDLYYIYRDRGIEEHTAWKMVESSTNIYTYSYGGASGGASGIVSGSGVYFHNNSVSYTSGSGSILNKFKWWTK